MLGVGENRSVLAQCVKWLEVRNGQWVNTLYEREGDSG